MHTFIIAEIGINHNGDINLAKDMINVAKTAGCDAVKFQKRDIDLVYTQDYLNSKRESPWGETQRDQKAGLEFGQQEFTEIDQYCKELEIDWFASAWDVNSLKFLNQFNLKYNKVASAMVVDPEFLKAVAVQGRYTFISTGMSDMAMVDDVVKIFRDARCPFEIMHCVSNYPMPDNMANLRCIKTLRHQFNCDIGYSGHETGVAISCAAAAIGITSLERHVTLDHTMYGSDQAASLEPNSLRMLVGSVRKIERALGDGVVRCNRDEVQTSRKLRERYYRQ